MSYDMLILDDIIEESGEFSKEQWASVLKYNPWPKWKYKHKEWTASDGAVFWTKDVRWIWRILGVRGAKCCGISTAWSEKDLYSAARSTV